VKIKQEEKERLGLKLLRELQKDYLKTEQERSKRGTKVIDKIYNERYKQLVYYKQFIVPLSKTPS
jgi:hypothetical protein